jgi:cytochrome c oxidase subunit III
LLLSVIPMAVGDRSAMKKKRMGVQVGLAICLLFGFACIWLRFHEFWSLHFRWDENAYASITWTILGMHLLHLITGCVENGMMLAWVLLHGLDDKHARDVHVGAIYWYWIAGIWGLLYVVVFWAPRWM